MNGMDFTTSSDRSLCSTQSTERAGRDSDDLGHWMSNQAEYHSHIGSFYRSADPHCSPWIQIQMATGEAWASVQKPSQVISWEISESHAVLAPRLFNQKHSIEFSYMPSPVSLLEMQNLRPPPNSRPAQLEFSF